MTRERHIAIVQRVAKLDRSLAERVVDRVLEEIELDQEEVPAVDFPTASPDADVFRSPAEAEPPQMGSPSIVRVEEEKRVLVTPSEEEIQAVRFSRKFAPDVMPVGPKAHWDVRSLGDFLDSQVPQEITVVPEGTDVPVKLTRRMETLAGLDLVKVIFGLSQAAHPVPSQFHADDRRQGSAVDPMAVGIELSETFTIYDRTPPIEEKLGRIRDAARQAYRPREGKVVSRTPVQAGPLTFDSRAPHDEV